MFTRGYFNDLIFEYTWRSLLTRENTWWGYLRLAISREVCQIEHPRQHSSFLMFGVWNLTGSRGFCRAEGKVLASYVCFGAWSLPWSSEYQYFSHRWSAYQDVCWVFDLDINVELNLEDPTSLSAWACQEVKGSRNAPKSSKINQHFSTFKVIQRI